MDSFLYWALRMAQSTPICRNLPSGHGRKRIEAVLDLHLLVLRRQFDVIQKVFGDAPPHRSRELVWAVLEVLIADLRGERIAIRDLVARAEGLLSAPTLSRTISEAEQYGLLTSTMQGRLKLLKPTQRAHELLVLRADEAFLAFAGIIGEGQHDPAPDCPGDPGFSPAERTPPEASSTDLPEGSTTI
jgi:hypothetical protein